MPTFAYKARSADQPLIEGVIDADSSSAAIAELGKKGYFPISIERQDSAEESAQKALSSTAAISIADLSACLRQLSDLLDAGLPLISVITIASDQVTHPRLKAILLNMTAGIQEGKTLSRMMMEVPDVFPPFYTQLVYAGETGGLLGSVLSRLADHAEKQAELRSQTKAALAYPGFIVGVGVLTICFLLGAIIPRLAVLFSDFQQRLPLPTRILLTVSDVFRHHGWILLVAGVAGYLYLRQRGPNPAWAIKRDQLLLKIPGVRTWIANQEIAQFTRTLGALLENGVPILQAIEVTGKTLGNQLFRQAVITLQDPIREGRSLSQCLAVLPIFPRYVRNLVAVGEEGGKLDKALLQIAGTYERQAQRDLKMAMSLLEPTLILIIGLILGAVVISIMLPIFEINTLIQ